MEDIGLDQKVEALTPKVRPWNKLAVMLAAGLALFACTAGALVWVAVAKLAEREFADENAQQARTLSAIISRDLAEHMLAGGGVVVWDQIAAEARQYVEMTGALKVLVLNANGVVRAASEPSVIGTRMELRGNPECPGCDWTRAFPASSILTAANGSARLRIVNSIPTSRACLGCHANLEGARGFISVDFDLSPLTRSVGERDRAILVLGIGATLMLIALVTFMLRRLVVRPVISLGDAMDRLAAGNLSQRAEVNANNEIGVLSTHFNFMAMRLEAARTESNLLYMLVVEASKKLEMTDFTGNLSHVIQDNLLPSYSVFILETSSGGWTCAINGETEREPVLYSGEDQLGEAIETNPAIVRRVETQNESRLIADAYRLQKLQMMEGPETLSFALPVISDGRLLGLLFCARIPARIHVSADFLQNLGVHLMLAANNSRNYTGAITDGLTRLGNKQYGLIRLEEAVFSAKRYNVDVALAMCDIDHFKRINDSFGHLAGDRVLREVSHRIKGCMRKADIAVRYGGEEFMLIMPQIGVDSLATVGEKVRQAVSSAPIEIGSESIQVTISIGLAAYDAKTESGQALIARADAALYRAKKGGRNRVEVDY